MASARVTLRPNPATAELPPVAIVVRRYGLGKLQIFCDREFQQPCSSALMSWFFKKITHCCKASFCHRIPADYVSRCPFWVKLNFTGGDNCLLVVTTGENE
ncbi:hypothetical protein [Massilia rhizosphaerae]|uniref:hypothetical protein n=1 Tax=Massilia rhizosphaerae TaxID=2784389 RepID=UPI0018DC7547|nr:hypothetical protein [Massilia rhizosphaerae]